MRPISGIRKARRPRFLPRAVFNSMPRCNTDASTACNGSSARYTNTLSRSRSSLTKTLRPSLVSIPAQPFGSSVNPTMLLRSPSCSKLSIDGAHHSYSDSSIRLAESVPCNKVAKHDTGNHPRFSFSLCEQRMFSKTVASYRNRHVAPHVEYPMHLQSMLQVFAR